MSNSHAEEAELTCRACGREFAAGVWVIVDADERPDLAARLVAGTLHDLTCPHCGHTATLNAPLLLLRPAAEPALLFCPARGDDPARDEEQAAALVGLLREHIGAAWRAEWLAGGVVGVAREALPAVLGDPLAAARLATAAATDGDDVPPAVFAALQGVLSELAAAGLRVQTPDDLRRALAARPELAARLAAALRFNQPDLD